MAGHTGAHLECVPLGEEEQDAVDKCKSSLDAAPFQANSDSAVDLSGLDGVVQNFVEEFAVGENLSSKDSLITALRISKPMILRVPNRVLLIPTATTSNTATVGKQAIRLGYYFHLTENVLLEPGFRCIAILAQ